MNKFSQLFITLLLGIAIGVTYQDGLSLVVDKLANSVINQQFARVTTYAKLDNSKVNICFTPTAKCGQLIVDEINEAKSAIYMQAYGLTHPQIVDALIKAKQRKIEVRILLDRSNLTQKYSKIKELVESGIEVRIDNVSGIAHNKVIILDNLTVITGSFNFTVAADTRNAENVLIIDNSNIAQSYLQNWLYRSNKSESYKSMNTMNTSN